MPAVVVVGLQWGDEGKGKIVDVLSEFADMVVRFQGGANAGHTIEVPDRGQVITHLVPSGIMRPGKQVVIGPAVVVDTEQLLAEIAMLREAGVPVEPGQLLVSDRAQVVLPHHKALDRARELARGKDKIGTTLRGIGPCLEDKAARCGIRIGEWIEPDVLAERLSGRLAEVNLLLQHYGQPTLQLDEVMAQATQQAEQLAPFVGDAGQAVRKQLERGRNVLFEGAQGTLLDIDHGTYPFVTSSNTIAAAACVSLGIGPGRIDAVVGVAKAYTTRVGAGPFPTELEDERGERLREAGGEFGATTGRPRRCGWLDLVALGQAIAMNGVSSLCLTKLDVVGRLPALQVCSAYRLEGKPLESLPPTSAQLDAVEAVYESLEGWPEEDDLREARELEALPPTCRRYLHKVEAMLNVPIDMVSVGPGRNDTIMLANPFRRSQR